MGRLPVFLLIVCRAANNHVLCSLAKYSWADDIAQLAKNEMWASEVCFACLAWFCGLFVRTLVSLTNAYAGSGRPTLKFIERFWLGSVRSASKLNSKCIQMNYEMNCITIHKCTEMYSEPDVQNHDNLRPEPQRSSLRRRDEKLNADRGVTKTRNSETAKQRNNETAKQRNNYRKCSN